MSNKQYKITLTRTGGQLGLVKKRQIDDQVAAAQTLVSASNILDLTAVEHVTATASADAYVYTFEVEIDGERRILKYDDTDLPKSLRALVQYMLAMSA
jgi:hypothetical protein